jgi:RimJ/RimL family protein N-acetyltransferase
MQPRFSECYVTLSSGVSWTTRHQLRRPPWLSDIVASNLDDRPDNLQYWLNWAIVVPTEVIGFVQATVTNEAADIAYVIGREYQSRGHATDAVRAMLAFVEEALGVTTEYATVDARNKPSRMLLGRLGFTLADGEDMQNLRFMRALR